MWRAFFKALFAAIKEYIQERQMEQAYQEALIENARRDEEAKQRAGANATRERMRNAEAAMGDDPAVLREWLRSRDPDTK
jgi:methylphosphotriester-DNA--protein-cysteine methyltransferase